MKKKILGGLLTIVTLTTLVGCSNSKSSDISKKSEDTSSKVEKKKKTSDKKETAKKVSDTKNNHEKEMDTMIEAAQSQVATIKKQQSNTYSDITITKGENDTIIYTYILKNKVPSIDSEALKPTLVKQVKPAMSMVTDTIPDIKMQFIFLNPDKSEIANITVTKDDIDKLDASSDSTSSN